MGSEMCIRDSVETPALSIGRRVSLSVAALQEAGRQATEEPDLAVERLVERGPEMFMDPAEKESARKVALEESVTDAVAHSASRRRSAYAGSLVAASTRFVERCGVTPLRAWSPCVSSCNLGRLW